MKDCRRCAQVHQESIDLAVVVVIAETCTPSDRLHVKHWAGLAGYIDKLAIPQSAKDRMLFRYQVDQPAMEGQDVEDAVISKIVDSGAPTHVLSSHRRDAGRSPDIVELHLPVVVHQAVRSEERRVRK